MAVSCEVLGSCECCAGCGAYVMWRVCCRKTEVMQLLETAGFSRANPYNVVQQGKVGPLSHPRDPSCVHLAT